MPIIPQWDQYPAETFDACAKRDLAILRSFTNKYHSRLRAEQPHAEYMLAHPSVVVAHIIYSTG
ncbi:MAG: hypothetical protein R3B13_16480 [Polyangiaceae bacterium]